MAATQGLGGPSRQLNRPCNWKQAGGWTRPQAVLHLNNFRKLWLGQIFSQPDKFHVLMVF